MARGGMLLRYPGGKAWLGDTVAAAARSCGKDTVTEPFLGGGGSAIRCMVLGLKVEGSDSNPYLCALWNVIRERPDDLIRAVRDVRPGVEDFRRRWESLRERREMDELEGAISKLVVHQMSYSGLGERAGSPIGGWSQTRKDGQPSAYLIDCRWKPDRLEKRIRHLHDLLDACLVGRVACSDFSEVLLRGTDSLLYLDPPYLRVGHQLYTDAVPHERLLEALRLETRPFLLSYDRSDEVLGWYSDMIVLSVRYRSRLVGSKNEGQELVITNDERIASCVCGNLPVVLQP